MHSLKNNQNFHVKSESGTAEADATVYVWLLLTHVLVSLAQQPNIYILLLLNSPTVKGLVFMRIF